MTVGSNATFIVTATGTAPLSYQWRKNGANVAGATSSTLTLTGVTTNQAGSYVVLVSNTAGSVTSSPAILTVNPASVAPTITTQPASQTVMVGGNVTFNVTATGTETLTYQWRLNGVNIASATGSTLALTSVTTNQAGSYVVLVSNSAGSVTSSPALVTVTSPDDVPPTIYLRPLVTYVYTNTVTLSGTAADDRGVASVEVQQGDGAFVAANGTTNWVATVALDPGTNTIRVKATDTSGNASPITSSAIIYIVTTPLTLTINGDGVVAPFTNGQLLELGKTYSVTATPKAGSFFSHWVVGGVSITNSTLMFMMSSNLAITANFLLNQSPGSSGVYSGLFYPGSGEPSSGDSGFFTVNVTDKGSFSGKLLLAGASYSLKGEFDGALSARLNIKRKGATDLQVSLQLAAGSDEITGSVGDGSWQSDLNGYRAAVSAKSSANPFAGRYTMLLSNEGGSGESPTGHGAAALTVDTRGRVAIKGVLADGSPAAQSVPVAANGQVPLFVRLNRGKGLLLGWLTLINSTTNDIAGLVSWTKQADDTGLLFPAGFTNTLAAIGSRYAPSGPQIGAGSSGNTAVVLEGGYLPSILTTDVLWSGPNHITVGTPNPTALALAMSASTGFLKGKFSHPLTGNPLTIRGAFLQKQDLGGGFFFGPNLAGSMTIEHSASVP